MLFAKAAVSAINRAKAEAAARAGTKQTPEAVRPSLFNRMSLYERDDKRKQEEKTNDAV